MLRPLSLLSLTTQPVCLFPSEDIVLLASVSSQRFPVVSEECVLYEACVRSPQGLLDHMDQSDYPAIKCLRGNAKVTTSQPGIAELAIMIKPLQSLLGLFGYRTLP